MPDDFIEPGPPPPSIVNPDWLRKPTGDDLANYYPEQARRLELDGRATISCAVTEAGDVERCVVVSEAPADMDFGQAALNLAPLFKMRPKSQDGIPVEGTVTIPIVFRIPKTEEPAAPSPFGSGLPSLDALTGGIIVAVVVAALALFALVDRLRGRAGAPTLKIGAALAYGVRFVAAAWAAAPGPLLLCVGLLCLELAWTAATGDETTPTIIVNLLFLPVGLMVGGACYRLVFAGYSQRPDMRLRRFGLQFGGVEGRLFMVQLLAGMICLGVVLALGIIGFLAVTVVGALGGGEAQTAPLAALIVGLSIAVMLYLAGRLFVVSPAAAFREEGAYEGAYGKAWGLGRASVFAGVLFWAIYLLGAVAPSVLAGLAAELLAPDEPTISFWLTGLAGTVAFGVLLPFFAGLGGYCYLSLTGLQKRPAATPLVT